MEEYKRSGQRDDKKETKVRKNCEISINLAFNLNKIENKKERNKRAE